MHKLTPKQEAIVFAKSGLVAVRACPGSGKTYTVAARLNRLLTGWRLRHQGIATLSFTNVACSEIATYLLHDFRRNLGYPHFLGTIDSFIDTQVFLPFGHLVMHCSGRPVLCGPPHDDYEPVGSWFNWPSQTCYRNLCRLNEFSYDESGAVVRLGAPDMGERCPANAHRPCVAYKRTFTKAGYATQSDANYHALQVLIRYPLVADALVSRFPLLMVDEAQDTSRNQMAIIDLLVEHGCKEIMLVGDADQAIYEWREADPGLFLTKCKRWEPNSVVLSENWRSTNRICSLLSALSSSPEGVVAVNPLVSDKGIPPQVWGYSSPSDLPGLMRRFLDLCSSMDIHDADASILSRSRDFLNQVRAGSAPELGISPWRERDGLSSNIARSKYLYDLGSFGEAFRTLQKQLCKIRVGKKAFNPADLLSIYRQEGFSGWRAALFELLASLPKTDANLSDWIRAANIVLASNPATSGALLAIKKNSQKCKYGELSFEAVFGRGEAKRQDHPECYVGTVHSVKGRTLPAVMVVLKSKAGRSGYYVNLLHADITTNEELRILYVALSRASHVLVVVVPAQDVAAWRERFRLGDATGSP